MYRITTGFVFRISILAGICLASCDARLVLADESPHFFAEEQAAVRAAVARIAPTLVRIQTLGGLESVHGVLASDSPTTGILISKDGYLLSSAFNFLQEPTSILVTLSDGSQHPAKRVARDHARQLVLLKIDTDQELPTPEIADRDAMRIGQRTIALGKALGGELPNISIGILSATDRIWGRAMQTDAKISPNNYGGPLIDLQGRVLGLLVPLSPQSNSDVAGVEWYDSGIGFAAYLDDLDSRLKTLKSGKDLYPGLMGVSLKGRNIFTMPAVVAAVQAGSPAADAGIKTGDEIIAVDGHEVSLQTHLKHALGVRYAGETVRLTLRRSGKAIETDLQLAQTIEPYATPLLGILPKRSVRTDTDTPRQVGIAVRFVYPNSPAAKAGIGPGCRILGIGNESLDSVTDWRTALASYQAGDTLHVTWEDATGKNRKSEVVLAELPTKVPDELPFETASTDSKTTAETLDSPPTRWLEVNVPELPNECFALVPARLQPDENKGAGSEQATEPRPYGVLVLLTPPGKFNKESLKTVWQEACGQRQLIMLFPRPRDAKRWQRDESEFVRKAFDSLGRQFDLDAHRIAIMGQQAGGAMALHFTLANRDLVRGLALVDAQLPARIRPPENRPLERLDIFLFSSTAKAKNEPTKQLVKLLQKQKFPVLQSPLKDSSELDGAQRAALSRWIDTLDRI